MKQLKEVDLEKLSELPIDILTIDIKKKDREDYHSKRHSSWHPVSGIWPNKIVERLLQKNIGKSFDLTFSYYCKLVPKYMQYIFLDEFNPVRRYSWWYYIDEKGLIQKITYKRKRIYSVTSFDYKAEWVYQPVDSKKPWGKWTDNRVLVVKQGWIKYFEGKTLEYKKLLKQENLKKEKVRLDLQNTKSINANEALKKSKDKIKQEKLENKLKMIRKGFDPLTSFRN